MLESKVASGELDPESDLVKHKLKGGHDEHATDNHPAKGNTPSDDAD